MKNLFILLLAIGISANLSAQDRFKQYGHGILHKGGLNTFWQNEDKAFDVFDGPGGERVGIMKYERYQLRVHWIDSSKIDEYGGYGAFDYGAEVNPYVYWYSRREDFVLLSYPDEKKGLWLNEKQFRPWGIESASWEEVLDQRIFSPTHIIIAEPCLNLRMLPEKGAKKITCLNNRFIVSFTGNKVGSWREVKATHFKYNCFERQKEMGDIPKDATQEVLESHTGWIKIVNDQGAPYLFYHLCGC